MFPQLHPTDSVDLLNCCGFSTNLRARDWGDLRGQTEGTQDSRHKNLPRHKYTSKRKKGQEQVAIKRAGEEKKSTFTTVPDGYLDF